MQTSKVDNTQKKYQDGYAMPGLLSYKGGNLKDWQKKTWPLFVALLGLDEKTVKSDHAREFNAWVKKFIPPTDPKHPFNTLLRPSAQASRVSGVDASATVCKTEDANGKPLVQDYFPPRYELKKDHMVLYSCMKDTTGIRVYNIVYEGYQGKLLSALLFIPNETKAAIYDRARGKVPTLIFNHGHLANKYQAAFNPKSYMHGIAYHAALNGFVVFAPDVRGFADSKSNPNLDSPTDHQNIAAQARANGSNFYAYAAMDAIYAQDFLEKSDMREFGLKREIDTNFNMIAGVSMGGRIALFAGALDDRFEVISTHGIFIGHEILESKFHCSCNKTPSLTDKLNVFDIGLLMAPRTLHLAMGGKDYFFNNFGKSAIEMFAGGLAENDNAICLPTQNINGLNFMRNISLKNRFLTNRISCPLVLEIDGNAGHELIGLGQTPQKFWHDHLSH